MKLVIDIDEVRPLPDFRFVREPVSLVHFAKYLFFALGPTVWLATAVPNFQRQSCTDICCD
jgi:hypothetical protein